MSNKIYCDKVNYIDNDYICWYTGKPCTNTPLPNMYECREYTKHNILNLKSSIRNNK